MTALDQCRRPLRVEKSELFEEAFDAICRYAGRLASLSASEPQLAARDPAARVLSRRQDDQEGVIVLVRRESRVVRCFTADVGREETGRSVARSLSVHAELVTDPCEATETM
jgi:hypothetical protein